MRKFGSFEENPRNAHHIPVLDRGDALAKVVQRKVAELRAAEADKLLPSSLSPHVLRSIERALEERDNTDGKNEYITIGSSDTKQKLEKLQENANTKYGLSPELIYSLEQLLKLDLAQVTYYQETEADTADKSIKEYPRNFINRASKIIQVLVAAGVITGAVGIPVAHDIVPADEILSEYVRQNTPAIIPPELIPDSDKAYKQPTFLAELQQSIQKETSHVVSEFNKRYVEPQFGDIIKIQVTDEVIKNPLFIRSAEQILKREGGYNNLANDYETNFGVTAPTLKTLLPVLHKFKPELFSSSVSVKTLTREQALYIYAFGYGSYIESFGIASPVVYDVFLDRAINFGVDGGLQMLLGQEKIDPEKSDASFDLIDTQKLSDPTKARAAAGELIINSEHFRRIHTHGWQGRNLAGHKNAEEFEVGWLHRDQELFEKLDKELSPEERANVERLQKEYPQSPLTTEISSISVKGKTFQTMSVKMSYWNQLYDKNGKQGVSENRRQCGAASTGMIINAYLSHIKKFKDLHTDRPDYFSRSMFFQGGMTVDGQNNAGLFAITSGGMIDSQFNYSNPGGIKTALAKYGLASYFEESSQGGIAHTLTHKINEEIIAGRPMMIGYNMGKLSHWAVLKGVLRNGDGSIAGFILADPKGLTGPDGPSGPYTLKGENNPVMLDQFDGSYLIGFVIPGDNLAKQIHETPNH